VDVSKYQVFDTETENHVLAGRKASPFDPRNWIVANGWRVQGQPVEYWCRVWCCQLAEYLLEGQQQHAQICSLDSVVEKYGGHLKNDEVKALWGAGYLTSQIPKDLLLDYLVGSDSGDHDLGDVGNTELVYLGQLARARKTGMLVAIQERMDALMASTEMEFNGLKIDRQEAMRRAQELGLELVETQRFLDDYIKTQVPDQVQFNWGSKYHLSALIFGGAVKYRERGPVLDENMLPVRKKEKEAWPLFGGVPVSPRFCVPDPNVPGLFHFNAKGDFLSVEEQQSVVARLPPDWSVSAAGELRAPFYRCQDTFQSGKRRGEPKTRQIDVPGEIKTKWYEKHIVLPAQTDALPEWKTKNTQADGTPVYSTKAEVLEVVEASVKDVEVLGKITRRSALVKELSTYYMMRSGPDEPLTGMLTLVGPDDIVHHNLNHTTTKTTRLSSSNPNLQNLPRADKSEVKRMFVSRFGDEGCMGEIDFSQLEVVVQAWLTGDKQMIQDCNDRVDFHCKRVSEMHGVTYDQAIHLCKDEHADDHKLWKSRRTGAKIYSFQKAYGAGAAKIAKFTGMDVEQVKQLEEVDNELYPGIAVFNRNVEQEVIRSAPEWAVQQYSHQLGFQVAYRKGYYTAPTGTRYVFTQGDALDFMIKRGEYTSFSPTEMKNYPIQGTAGELVQLIIGKLWRRFVETENYNGKARLINTVHDCVWFDMHKDVAARVMQDAEEIMSAGRQYLRYIFDIDPGVEFPVDAEVGDNMYDLHHAEKYLDALTSLSAQQEFKPLNLPALRPPILT